MSFINQNSFIIRKSNKHLVNIYFTNNLCLDFYNSSNELTHSTTLTNFIPSQSSYINFTLSNNDLIQGIYKKDNLKLLSISNSDNSISQCDLLSYNNKKFNIIFPFFKNIDNSYHILYYLYNNSSRNTCVLFHHYCTNGVWIENKIDFINHIVLDNFTVLWSNNSPIVFYFNLVNGFEEVFFSRFNINSSTWSKPCQITSSKKHKIYLSVIKDSMNFYHITFCENIDNGYSVRYLNGFLNDLGFSFETDLFITGSSSCMYPSLIKENNKLNLMWVNFNRLYTCSSDDFGTTWSDHSIDEISIENDFTMSKFLSNYKEDSCFNLSNTFNIYKSIDILGF